MNVKNDNLTNLSEAPFKMNLQLFADGGEGGEGGSDDNSSNDNSNQDGADVNDTNKGDNGDGKGDEGSNEPNIPKHRFDEVNTALKDAQKQLKALQDAKKQEEIDAQKKKGEFETLYNDTNAELETTKTNLNTANERVEVLEGVINGLLEQTMSDIDEQYHDLIPNGMTPEAKLSWLAQAKAKGLFGKEDNSEKPLGNSTNGGSNNAKVDTNSMSPLQMLSSAYGAK